MNRYRCNRCNEVFNESSMEVRKYDEMVPYGDTYVPMPMYETFCPFCGEEDPEEHDGYDECPNCGKEYFRDGECMSCGYEEDEEGDE